MADNNSLLYKNLRAKSANKRQSTFDFTRALDNVVEELFPSRPASRQQEQQPDGQPDYDEKLQALQKQQDAKLDNVYKQSNAKLGEMAERLQSNESRNHEMSQSLMDAIQKVAQRGAGSQSSEEEEQEDAITQPTGAETEGTNKEEGDTAESTIQAEDPFEEEVIYKLPTSSAAPTSPASAKPASEEAASEKVKKVISSIKMKPVKIGDNITVGQNYYKITNTFGPRTGANAVPGRKDGEHSRGMDLVGFSADGKQSNIPIALTDGVIKSVTLQGSGKVINPKHGKEGGYIMEVQMPDGKIMKYMHLSPDAFKNKASLVGKPIKRGDILYEGDYSKGSGSQTGNHVKVSITSVDAAGNQLKDYEAPENDPTTYAVYGRYLERQEPTS